MTYLDWVERVFGAAWETWEEAGGTGAVMFVPIQNLAVPLGLVEPGDSFHGSDRSLAIMEAVQDLNDIGMLDTSHGIGYSVTERGEAAAGLEFSSLWQNLAAVGLSRREEAFLSAAVAMSIKDHSTFARAEHVRAMDVLAASLPETTAAQRVGLSYSVPAGLALKGMVQHWPAGSGEGTLRPTYGGVVRATQKQITTDQALLGELVARWETVEVELKEMLDLSSKRARAEFARDILGLVNTQATAARYLIVGFKDSDPDHPFTTSVDQKVTGDHLEDLLHNYCSPVPIIRFRRVPQATGDAALIEVAREPHQLPYLAIANEGKLQDGALYVRHGTHVTTADPEEARSIVEEGERARARAGRTES